jgi:protein involved in polysaccharide export with SLBB domain
LQPFTKLIITLITTKHMYSKYILILFFALGVLTKGHSQSLFMSQDLSKVNTATLSQSDINKIRNEMQVQNLTIEDLKTLSVSKGMSLEQFSILEERLNKTPSSELLVKEQDLKPDNIHEKEDIDIKHDSYGNSIFGSEIFSNSRLTFEPNQQLATPNTYELGTGDELQIVIHGIQQYAQNAQINKEGKIVLNNIGAIHIAGLQFGAAVELIKQKSSRIYTTLLSNESEISVTLTNVKSIQITMIGVEKPGNYTVSSLSTVFNALHAAGGPNKKGSYRAIELIRKGKVIKTIDLYDFLLKGDLSSNLNLQNDDIIRVPNYTKHVKLLGQIQRPGIFELKENETFKDLLVFCSGFTEEAYTHSFELTRITDKELKLLTIEKKDFDALVLFSGDIIEVGKILATFENKVSIKGAVYRPKRFELKEGMRISDLIELADGLTDDAFKQRALLVRKGKDLIPEIIGVNLNEIISSSGNTKANISLQKEDELIVPSKIQFIEEQNVSIFGEIQNPGKYTYIREITLYDLIIQAGGFKESASRKVEIARIVRLEDDKYEAKSEIFQFEMSKDFKELTQNIKLEPHDVVSIRKMPQYELSQSVSIAGASLFPGKYVISRPNERVGDIIERAGGLTQKANEYGVKIIRSIEVVDLENNKSLTSIVIPINYQKIQKNKDSKANINIKENDLIVIEELFQTVSVLGAIEMKSEIPIEKNKRAKYYINASGGFKDNASKKRTYVIYANGIAKKTTNFVLFKVYPKPEYGSQIYVPAKPVKENNVGVREIIGMSSVLTSLTGMTFALINLLK